MTPTARHTRRRSRRSTWLPLCRANCALRALGLLALAALSGAGSYDPEGTKNLAIGNAAPVESAFSRSLGEADTTEEEGKVVTDKEHTTPELHEAEEEQPTAGEDVAEEEEEEEEDRMREHRMGHPTEHHGGGHEHHASMAMLTTSYLLIGFLVANFVLLQLVNWDDEHVRQNTWKMMSSTISIYLAVVLDGSLSKCIMAFMRSTFSLERPKGGCDLARTGISTAMFCIWLVGVNAACYGLGKKELTQLSRGELVEKKETGRYRLAVSEIFGHIAAFAGIAALEASVSTITDRMIWVVGIGCFVGLFLARLSLDALRNKVIGRETEAYEAMGKKQSRQETEEEEEVEDEEENSPDVWRESACEAEDEASCIVSSFIVREIVLKTLFSGEKEEATSAEASTHDMLLLAGAVGVCIFGVIATTYANKIFLKCKKGSSQEVQSTLHGSQRWVNNFRSTTAMSTSWLFLRLFWLMSAAMFPQVGMHFIEIISAGLLTAFAILVILVLDKLADWIAPDVAKNTAFRRSNGTVRLGARRQPEQQVSAQEPEIPEGTAISPASAAIQAFGDMGAAEAMEVKNLEKAVRDIIISVSLSVGLAWEHAFHAATDTVIANNTIMHEHRLLSRSAVAVLSFGLMIMPWMNLIVPKARMSAHAFKDMMDEEKNALRGIPGRRSSGKERDLMLQEVKQQP